MIIDLNKDNYKKIKKIIKNDNESIKYKTNYNIKDYDFKNKEFWIIHICNALNIKDIKKRYSYIYDTMCEILDYISSKYCNFKNDKCECNRCSKSKHKINGCCYFNGELCKYLVEKRCIIKNISCKIFMCEYIEKKYKFRSKVDEYPLINLFFNSKQKNIVHYSYRKDKDEVINLLIKEYER